MNMMNGLSALEFVFSLSLQWGRQCLHAGSQEVSLNNTGARNHYLKQC